MDLKKKDIINRVMTQEGFLGAIRYEDVVNWLSNFQNGSPIGYILLENLIVLNRDQIKSCIRTWLSEIQSSIYKKTPDLSDEELFEQYKKHISRSAFVCAARGNDHASSANMMGRILRSELGEKLYHEYSFSNICKGIKNKDIETIYIIDDFIGTGIQMSGFICGDREAGQNNRCIETEEIEYCTLKCIHEHYSDIPMYILVIASHCDGKKHIKEKFDEIEIISTYTFDKSYDLSNSQCKLYADNRYSEALTKHVTEEINVIRNRYNMSSNKRFGLGIPICIEDRFPNNSLELYWWDKSDEWKPLMDKR